MKYKINFAPNKIDLRKIENWLIDEKEKYNEGFYSNWKIIEKSFKRKGLISFELNDIPIGFAVWRQSDILVEIDIMEIHYDYRKKGLGRLFLEMISEEFKNSGGRVIKLYCAPRESEYFWKKMGFIKFPQQIYTPHDLQYYKPLIEVSGTMDSSNDINKIELWDVEPSQSKNKPPRWCWNISEQNGVLNEPIIHPCDYNWNIRWTKNGKIEKEDKVKYFSEFNPISFDRFIYIYKLDS